MTKFSLTLVLFLLQCWGYAQRINSETVAWPPEYDPLRSNFYVRNEIEIEASPRVVWGALVDALRWQSWYKGAKNVSLVSQEDTLLDANTTFNWETMGLKFESTVRQYEPYRLLAWESQKKSIRGFHTWLLIPTERGGCKVITEESQNGWLTFFEKIFQPNKLQKLHDIWLTELKNKSENNQKGN